MMETTERGLPAKRAYTRHPFGERLRVVFLHESGLGSKRIARTVGLDDSMVRMWLRKYREGGLDALRDTRVAAVPEVPLRQMQRARKDELFRGALEVYATTLEPVTSIARRFGVDYKKFKYHVERHHPELTARRNGLKSIGNNL